MNNLAVITNPAAVPATVEARRVAAAFLALAPSSRRVYVNAFKAFEAWAAANGRSVLPSGPADVADYLEYRFYDGASPATLRMARAAIVKVHKVASLPNPADDDLVRDTLTRFYRDGRDRGRGQAAGVGWRAADRAVDQAAASGTVQGLRDAAIIAVTSDALLRVSEAAALQVSDIEADDTGGGTVTIRAGKTDQQGEGSTRYVGAPTMHAVTAWLNIAGIEDGPLFRQVRRGGNVQAGSLSPDAIRIVIRARTSGIAGVTGRVSGHSLRVGSARSLAADGASIAELQQAGGWKSPTTPGIYVRREAAAQGPVARRRYKVGK